MVKRFLKPIGAGPLAMLAKSGVSFFAQTVPTVSAGEGAGRLGWLFDKAGFYGDGILELPCSSGQPAAMQDKTEQPNRAGLAVFHPRYTA